MILCSVWAQAGSGLELGVSHDSLSGAYDDWRGLSLQWDWQTASGHGFALAAARQQRFALIDQELRAAWTRKFDQAELRIEIEHSPQHRILPRLGTHVHASMAAGPGRLLLDGSWREYQTSRTRSFKAGYEQYAGAWYWQGGLQVSDLSGVRGYGWQARADYYYQDNSRIGLQWGQGDEAEQSGVALRRYRVSTLGLQGLHSVNREWSLRWRIERARQGDFYWKNGINLGLRRHF
ncbi:YaiO family outer membrane beta-barrel protein [Massilia sp. W12]|uniref:YaiO family outer membrane beta-barrel protein n=1 Tax=Massilia sp. W12 TaxID=3126507 RepID=UPI0030D5B614